MKQRIFQRLLMTAAVAGLLTVGAHAARRSVPVQVDADTLPVRGYVDSGVTYVPLRALLNGLDAGWRVWWDSSAGQAAAESEDDTLWADPAADTLTVNSRTFHGRVTVENGVTKAIRVDMGEPILTAAEVPVVSKNEQSVDEEIVVDNEKYRMTCVSMGNPHAVVFVDSTADFPLEQIGPHFENHERFPRRTNTEIQEVLSPE